MATARKGTKKAATSAAVDGLFGGKATKKKAGTKAAKARAVVQFPKELRDSADVCAAYRTFKDSTKKKADLAEKQCKTHMNRWWAEQFALTGKRPEMAHFEGNVGGFDFIVTRRITITADKQEQLEMIGADIGDYTETSGIKINMDAVARLGYMDKLQAAIQQLVSDPEHVSEIFEPVVTVTEGILEALPTIAEDCEADGELADKIEAVMEILSPTSQIKKAEMPGKTAAECFELVNDTKISSKG